MRSRPAAATAPTSAPPTGPGGPRRYRRITEGPGHFELDLSSGTPDPTLLPDLGPIVSRVGKQSLTSSYLDHPVLPALEEELRRSWPFEPEAVTVVDGAMDALDRVAQVVLRLGDRVVVEHPSFPPLLDLLDQLGCAVVPVDVDDDGPSVAGLRAGAAQRATCGRCSCSRAPTTRPASGSRARRARALAELLTGTDTVVVEDDHANDISARRAGEPRRVPARTAPCTSAATPRATARTCAWRRSGGAGEVVTAVANRRLLGPGWSSRILQALLLELLQDPATPEVMATARAVYGRRRAIVADALAAAGVAVSGRDGINLWMRVANERSAAVALATRGIGVAPGEPFLVRPDDDHLRVTVGLITGPDDHVAAVADHLAHAAGRLPTRQPHHR